MYSILIVDDELNVREGLASFNWSSMGFTVVGEASYGKTALELLAALHPDVLITDLKMPVMDGMSLIAELVSSKSSVKIIILSGYGEFELAQKALRFGVADYLLKPVDEDELALVMEKIRSELDESTSVLRHSSPVVPAGREKSFQDLVLRMENVQQFDPEYGEPLIGAPWFAVAVVEPDTVDGGSVATDRAALTSSRTRNREIIDRTIGNSGRVYVDRHLRHALLLQAESHENMRNLCSHLAESLVSELVQGTGCTHSVGISSMAERTGNPRILYLEACQALCHRFFNGNGSVIFFDTISNNKVPHRPADIVSQTLLIAVQAGDFERIEVEAKRLMTTLMALQLSPEELKGAVFENLMAIARQPSNPVNCVDNDGLDPCDLFGIIAGMRTVQEIQGLLEDYAQRVARIMIQNWSATPRAVVQKTIDLIHERYAENLSLKQISESVFLCHSYLGRLFRQATGESFNCYLNRVRIEHAQQLLLSGEHKIYEVARDVGYKSVDYFRDQFTAITGSGPAAFKSRRKSRSNDHQ
jgi:two-component system response regulator YesN